MDLSLAARVTLGACCAAALGPTPSVPTATTPAINSAALRLGWIFTPGLLIKRAPKQQLSGGTDESLPAGTNRASGH
jgi:hypothetical protein